MLHLGMMSAPFQKSKQLVFALTILSSLCANEMPKQSSVSKYLELHALYPQALGPKGDWKMGEIELVWDLPTMMKIQAQFAQPVGIVAEDRFWIWVRDAIILPSGKYSTYNRFFPKKGLDGPAGVVILAVTPHQEILVNLIYRHATRSWEIELPRGGRNLGETAEVAARREVKEETGYKVIEILPLGTVATDSGILSNCLRVFFAQIDKLEEVERDEEEAILSVVTLPKNKVIEIFCDGQMEFVVNGQRVIVSCRDSFFAYAILLAEKKGLL